MTRAETPLDSDSSKLKQNKAIVGRWFTEFWGKPWNRRSSKISLPLDMLLQYSLHAPRRGRADIKAFMGGFRGAFPLELRRHG